MRRPASSTSSSVHSPHSHRVRHRNFIIWYEYAHMSLVYAHQYLVILTGSFQIRIWYEYAHMSLVYAYQYLVILTGSFQMAAILVLLFDLLSCPYSHRNFILHILTYLFFTFLQIRNNSTVTFFLSIFLKFFKAFKLNVL